MKVIKNVISSNRNKRFGNHYVKIDGCIRSCIYHGSVICMVNDITKEYYINDELKSIGAINTRQRYIDYLIANNYTDGKLCKIL